MLKKGKKSYPMKLVKQTEELNLELPGFTDYSFLCWPK
jgi:hypothetical protein